MNNYEITSLSQIIRLSKTKDSNNISLDEIKNEIKDKQNKQKKKLRDRRSSNSSIIANLIRQESERFRDSYNNSITNDEISSIESDFEIISTIIDNFFTQYSSLKIAA